MKLKRLQIKDLPGVAPGFELKDLNSECNLIVGPNAIGKSSLVRALQYLLAPPSSSDPSLLSLSATFVDGQDEWTVKRVGSSVEWLKNGVQSDAPNVASADQLPSYFLSMEVLIKANAQDEGLLSDLRKALGGGYDLSALAADPKFKVSNRMGVSQARALNEAKKHRKQIESKYEEIRIEESELPKTEKLITDARMEKSRVDLIEKTLALLDAVQDLDAQKIALAKFPANMQNVRGDEITKLEEIFSNRASAMLELSKQDAILEASETQIKDSAIEGDSPTHSEIEARNKDLVDAGLMAQNLSQLHDEIQKFKITEEEAAKNLGSPGAPPSVDTKAITDAETFAGRFQDAERVVKTLQEEIDDLPQAVSEKRIEGLVEAVSIAREWLAVSSAEKGRQAAPPMVAFLVAVIGIGAATMHSDWIAAVSAGIAASISFWLWVQHKKTKKTALETEFAELGNELAPVWNDQGVKKAIATLEEELADLREKRTRSSQAQKLNQDLKRETEILNKLKEEKKNLQSKLGIDPTLTAAAIDRFIRLVSAYEGARNSRLDKEKKKVQVEEELESCLERVRAFLASRKIQVPDGGEPSVLEIGMSDIKARVATLAKALAEKGVAEKEIVRLKKSLDDLAARERLIFQNAGVIGADIEQLRECVGQHSAWTAQSKIVDAAITKVELCRLPIMTETDLISLVDKGNRTTLSTELEKAKDIADKLEELTDKRMSVQTKIKLAGSEHELEHALVIENEAKDSLMDAYFEVRFSEAADFLIDAISNEYRTHHQPEVLRDARERFRAYTHSAYELEIDTDRGFVARDTKLNEQRSLNELSSATRMQMLLAMRMAWTKKIEDGKHTLPLFLDEALTTSDEGRFRQIVSGLQRVARQEGRQIFYLSARKHEVALWEQALGSRPNVIDLEVARFKAPSSEPEDYKAPPIDKLPSPKGMTSEDFAAALGVPQINPGRPEGEVHLYYLLRDDLDLVHKLIDTWEIKTVGQFESLLKSPSAVEIVGDRVAELRARCLLVREWFASWRQGRGKRIDKAVLLSSETISDTFIDEVSNLALSLHGDAKALVSALESKSVAKMRSATITSLKEWLEQHGYIDHEEMLDKQGRLLKAIEAISGKLPVDGAQELVRWLEISVEKYESQESGSRGTEVESEFKSGT